MNGTDVIKTHKRICEIKNIQAFPVQTIISQIQHSFITENGESIGHLTSGHCFFSIV